MPRSSTLRIKPAAFFLFAVFSAFATLSAPAAGNGEKRLLAVASFENQRGIAELDWIGAYLSMMLRASIGGLPEYSVPSADVSILRGVAPESAKNDGARVIGGYYQTFDDLLSVRLNSAASSPGEEILVKGRLSDAFSLARDLAAKIDPRADFGAEALFPDSEEPAFKTLLQFEALRMKGETPPVSAEFEALEADVVSWAHPDPFIAWALPVALEARKAGSDKMNRSLPSLRAIARDFLKEFPAHSELKSFIALTHYLTNNNHVAMERFARPAVSDNPNNDLARLMLALSLGMNTGEAKAHMLEFERINPWAKDPLRRDFYMRGTFAEVLKNYREKGKSGVIEQLGDSEPLSQYEKSLMDAKSKFSVGEEKQAEEAFKNLVEDYPEKAEPRLLLSGVYLKKNEHAANIELLDRFSAGNPEDNALVNKNAGDSHYALQNCELALERYGVYLESSRSDVAVLHRSAICSINLKNPQAADEYLDRALIVEPNNSETWRHKGETAFRRGNKEQAIKFWKKSLRFDPRNEKTINRLNATQ